MSHIGHTVYCLTTEINASNLEIQQTEAKFSTSASEIEMVHNVDQIRPIQLGLVLDSIAELWCVFVACMIKAYMSISMDPECCNWHNAQVWLSLNTAGM